MVDLVAADPSGAIAPKPAPAVGLAAPEPLSAPTVVVFCGARPRATHGGLIYAASVHSRGGHYRGADSHDHNA